MISKIQIKRINGSIIFEYEAENNSIAKTLKEYIRKEKEYGKSTIDLIEADLSNTNLFNIDLRDANLYKANLSHSDLREADLRSTNLKGANLKDAKLSGANLSFADLHNANLKDADLSFVNLSYADLKGSKLSGANFSDAVLTNVKNLKYAFSCFIENSGFIRKLLAVKIGKDIKLFLGFFKGNEAELRTYIESGSEQYKETRLMALELLLKFIEL